MEKHLASGCKQCKETVSLWQKVRKAASAEAAYQPAKASVRLAKAAFGISNLAGAPAKSRGLIEVLFDSLLQPALAGTRAAAAQGMRQMLYRADPYQIDIQVELKPGSNRLVVAGQVLDMSNPSLIARGLKVSVSNCRGNTVLTSTSDYGEFVGEVENSGDLELSVSDSGERPIVISLRNALDRLPGGKS